MAKYLPARLAFHLIIDRVIGFENMLKNMKKLSKNSLLSNFFRTFVVDLRDKSLNSENRPFSCQELKLKNPMRA